MNNNMKLKKITLLDCTFRDGGYYNNWHFSETLINKYLLAMSSSCISHVELGFRFISKDGFKGSNAYTSDDFLRKLKIPKNLSVGVMVNASDLAGSASVEEAVYRLFPEGKNTSLVDFVRIASHFHEIDMALEATKLIKELGFSVGLNLMQVSERSEEEIILFVEKSKNYVLDVIYVADSIGGLTGVQVENIFKIFKLHSDNIPFGFHAHDNLNLALSNTLCAMKFGASWLDCTVTGMGRGPGNTKAEELVIELSPNMDNPFDSTLLFDLVVNDFYPLKQKYQWGTNIFYYISGKFGIHPSYVQTMQSDNRFNTIDILSVLKHLKKQGIGSFFEKSLLNENFDFPTSQDFICWEPKEMLYKKDVLILGNGSSIIDHFEALSEFILKYRPIVIALNYSTSLYDKLIDIRVSSHPLRILADIQQYALEDKTVVIPYSLLDESSIELLVNKKNIKNFNYLINTDKFDCNSDICILPSNLSVAYALAIAIKGEVNNIYLSGIDGFEIGDSRNFQLENIFRLFFESYSDKIVYSLTNSKLRGIKVKSLYGY
jgi:4-hydroxy 2-oxovalerate aldolase